MRRRIHAFTTIELMIALTIITLLAMITGQSMLVGLARAKRVEAREAIGAILTAERTYFVTEDGYSGSFDQLGFGIDGGTRVSAVQIQGKVYTTQISGGGGSFYAQTTGDIDGDAWADSLIAQEGQ